MIGRVVVVALAAVLLGSTPAANAGMFGYRDTGSDPNDVQGVRVVDVRSTTRKVWHDDEGDRWLSITIRSYDRLGPHWSFRVVIDSAHGGRQDSKFEFTKRYAQAFCDWFVHGSGFEGRLSIFERRVTCRIPLRYVEPTKPIRWKLIDAGRGDGEEFAPDQGWYV
jgi:hypothetical protein